MSAFTRLWNFIRRPTGYVGKDLQGNYFYEHASTTSDPRRTRRLVKYKGKTDTLAVANRSRLLAVQWKSWLTHTRLHPPSLEELQADVARQERLRYNVALIEARDREERLRLAAGTSVVGDIRQRNEDGHGERQGLTAPQHGPSTHDGQSGAETRESGPTAFGSDALSSRGEEGGSGGASGSADTRSETRAELKHEQQQNQKQYEHDPWVPRPASDEPQPWTPRAVRRGG